jgi:hypothetical protein
LGKVLVDSSTTGTVVLTNDGGATCEVSVLGLANGSDPSYALVGHPEGLSIAPGESAQVSVVLTTGAAIMPLFRTATLDLAWVGPEQPDAGILISASVSADCTKTSQVIFTFDSANTLSAFDPSTLTFTDIGTLNCPGSSYPFSMSVDENGIAWTLYGDGSLFQVDTGNAACYATSYVSGQQGFQLFGMGDIFHSLVGTDTLFIAGGSGVGNAQSLGTIDFATLLVSYIAPLSGGDFELSGTGNGELWGFSPGAFAGGEAIIAQIDTTTGNLLTTYSLPSLPPSGSWAMKFHGDAFWIFESNQIFTVQHSDGSLATAVQDDGRFVVGAGVSTCATLQ